LSKKLAGHVAVIIFGIILALGLAEGALRLLPVNSGLNAQAVNEAQPVFRFRPDADYVWSKGPGLSMVNKGHINNEGFINDNDYEQSADLPVMAVIGDSYVEASMIPFPQSIAGRLAGALKEKTRVYSFAASGAPLSQYLAWAEFARKTYRPRSMVFVVVGNDFDESLLAYKQAPGFHYFALKQDGDPTLRRIDYEPETWRIILRRSALARYLILNLHADIMVRDPVNFWRSILSPPPSNAFAGNVPLTVSPERGNAAKSAVEAFFRELPARSGLPPERILFLVDGFRYPPENDEEAIRRKSGFFADMRSFFISVARMRGYSPIDMDDLFIPRFRDEGQRFDFAQDGHWNALGHRLAGEAVLNSAVIAQISR